MGQAPRIVLLTGLALVLPGFGRAGELSWMQRNLVGLRGVRILVEELGDAGRRSGLTGRELASRLRSRLESGGLSPGETPETPTLYLAAHLHCDPAVGCSVSVSLHLDDRILLERGKEPRPGFGFVWSGQATMASPVGQVPRRAHLCLERLVDRFLEDHRAANPRSTAGLDPAAAATSAGNPSAPTPPAAPGPESSGGSLI